MLQWGEAILILNVPIPNHGGPVNWALLSGQGILVCIPTMAGGTPRPLSWPGLSFPHSILPGGEQHFLRHGPIQSRSCWLTLDELPQAGSLLARRPHHGH